MTKFKMGDRVKFTRQWCDAVKAPDDLRKRTGAVILVMCVPGTNHPVRYRIDWDDGSTSSALEMYLQKVKVEPPAGGTQEEE